MIVYNSKSAYLLLLPGSVSDHRDFISMDLSTTESLRLRLLGRPLIPLYLERPLQGVLP